MARSVRNGDIVFIVDDDAALLESLKFSLEVDGYVVSTYPDAITLLCDARSRAYDCLIVDHQLAGMNGLQLIERLADAEAEAGAILVTTHPNAAVRARAAALGVAIVEKPLLGEALHDAIRAVVARRGA